MRGYDHRRITLDPRTPATSPSLSSTVPPWPLQRACRVRPRPHDAMSAPAARTTSSDFQQPVREPANRRGRQRASAIRRLRQP
jgi:hypothetical protein